jgi:hypothetical protein
MRSSVCLSATLMTIALLVPACGGYDAKSIEAGDCFQSGTAAAFGWGTEVSCDDPHTVEVFAVRDVGDTLGKYPRQDLDAAGSPAQQEYLALVREFCEPAWSNYAGYGDLGGSLAPDSVVLPAVYGDMALEATPAADWDNGNKAVLCYQVFGRPEQDGGSSISVDHPVLAKLSQRTAEVPIQVRDCAMSPVGDQGEQRLSCAKPHDREYLGHLNLGDFVGRAPGLDQTFLNRFDSVTAPQQQWAVLDNLCQQIFSPLLGDNPEGITLLAQVYTQEERWGWADQGFYHTACFARTTQQVTHSVVTPPAG